MSRSVVVIGVAAVLILGGGMWYWHRESDPVRVAARKQQAQATVMQKAQEKDYTKAVEAVKTQVAEIRATTVTEDQRFPLGPDAGFLTAPPPLPAKMPPVVFVAPLYGAGRGTEVPSRTTSILQEFLKFQLRASPRDRVVLNVVPQTYIAVPYERVGEKQHREQGRKPEEYLNDARLIGADYLIYGRADEAAGNIQFQLAMMDLATSRTDSFAVTVARDRMAEALQGAVRKCAQFCGVAPADIAAMEAGLPTARVLDQCLKTEESKASELRQMVAASPDCPALHLSAIQGALEREDAVALANDALRRWPDDARLLLAKAQALRIERSAPEGTSPRNRDARATATLRAFTAPVAAHTILSEVARRQPANIFIPIQMADSLAALDNAPVEPAVIASAYRAAQGYLGSLCERMPANWAARWDYAWLLNSFFRRGTALAYSEMEDATEITTDGDTSAVQQIAERYRTLSERAVAEINAAAQRRPDCTRLWVEVIRTRLNLAHDGVDALLPIVATIGAVDPNNVEGDVLLARSLGTTTETRYARARIYSDAMKRTNMDPDVCLRCAWALIPPIEAVLYVRDPYDADSYDYPALLNNPEADVFCETVESALAKGQYLEKGLIHVLFFNYHAQNRLDKKKAVWDSYVKPSFSRAMAALNKGDWAEANKWARAVYSLQEDPAARETMFYCMVKSLWKLNRHRESLEFAESGIQEFPNRPTFHYMFAVVALDLGDRLEEAYEHARIAVPLDPANQGIKDTLKKLGQKLGKPETL